MNVDKVKRCSYCNTWLSAKEIISDPRIKLIGMAFTDDESEMAYYFFQHEISKCGTSFLVNVQDLAQFIAESIPADKLTSSCLCEGHCVDLKDLGLCHQKCRFAPFRRFLFKMMALKERAIEEHLTKKPDIGISH